MFKKKQTKKIVRTYLDFLEVHEQVDEDPVPLPVKFVTKEEMLNMIEQHFEIRYFINIVM